MSVGLSQVDFDPKAIEDEEEAALDKEDQEREQEIHELLANELDDDLLEDDNASFSSHDFRSTTNSRASQQLDDSYTLHPESDSNGNEFADFPPRHGVFEKPALITQKGTNFISKSGNMQSYNKHQQYSSHPDDQDMHEQPNDGNYGYQGNHGNDGYQGSHGNDGYQGNHGDDGYHGDDVGIGSYSPDTNSNEEQYSNHDYDYDTQEGHHGSGHQGDYHDDHAANEYGNDSDCIEDDHKFNSYHGDDEHYNEEYGYNDAPEENELQPSAANETQNDPGYQQEDYTHTPSFPGNYRVQYVPGYRPQPQAAGTDWAAPQYPGQTGMRDVADSEGRGHRITAPSAPLPGNSGQNSVWRDVRQEQSIDRQRDGQGHIPGTNKDAGDYNEGTSGRQESKEQPSNVAQLQVLYQARGRKIGELNSLLEKKEMEMSRQIRVLNHQLMMTKDEHAGMVTSLEQSQQISQQTRQEVRQVEDKMNTALQQINKLEKEKQQINDQLHTANSTIDSLNEQVVQMTRADALTKAREQHESILNAARKRQEEEILRLKQKLDESRLSLDWKTEESSRLRDEVLEKGDIINRLTKTLDDTQRQCQELLRTGTVAEITGLRTQLEEAVGVRKSTEQNCNSMKNEISELHDQLSMYQNALKYGFSQNDRDSDSFSVARNLDGESWATPKPGSSSKDPQVQAVDGLRRELEHSLDIIRTKTEQVKQLEEKLAQVNDRVEREAERAERMERVALEQEKKINQLEAELQRKALSISGPAGVDKTMMRDFERMKAEHQQCKKELNELRNIEERLADENKNLKQHMAEMVADFDEDKQTSLDKCRNACLQLHEDSKQQLRMELEEEHQHATKELNDALEETKDELIRVKECYVQLREDSRAAEKTIRDELEKERDHLLNKETSTAIATLKSHLTTRHREEMDSARELWQTQQKEEVEKRVREAVERMKEQAYQKHQEDIQKAITEAVAEAQKAWKVAGNDSITLEKKLSEARVLWEQEREAEFKGKLQAAVNEARIMWRDEQKEKLRQDVDKAVAETKASVMKINAERYQHDLDCALLEARATWQRTSEKTRQREIEQEVEVAVTNAVAEARRTWERDSEGAKDANLRSLLAKEKLQWRAEEQAERQKAVEAAVAIAEVNWLEEEQRKITYTMDEALQAARATWSDEKQRDIVMAVDEAQREWASNQETEMKFTLETARAELVAEFDQRTREAVEMAVLEAKALWQRNHDQNNNQTQDDIESIKDKLWAEFEELREEDIQQAIDEDRAKWQEDQEELKQKEVSKAITYLEEQYARGLEEFKHKGLRDALAQARAEWENERELETDEMIQSRLEAEREEWKTARDQEIHVEVDRALATAREAWAANYQDELEQRVLAEVTRVREEVTSQAEEAKQRAVGEALKEAKRKQELERKKHKEELERLKAVQSPEALPKRWEHERMALRSEHEKELNRVHEESTKRARDDAEKELEHKLVEILQEAKQHWEEELEEERVQLEEQHHLKIKSLLEKAKEEHSIEKEKAIQSASERAVKQQQQLWMNERRTTQSALDKIREEMTRVKQKHVNTIEALKREHTREIKKLRDGVSRKSSMDSGMQTPLAQESASDTSFGSADQLTAARGLHELRHQYLDTVAKIRDDVLDHVKQTKTTAAKKIRNEVLKERHSTAKKLRRYYLQCLKQLLEEDKVSSDSNHPAASVREKIERMTQALDAASPENGNKGQQVFPKNHTKIPSGKRPLQTSKAIHNSEPKEIQPSGTKPSTGRPGEYGPDGESDPPRPSPSDRLPDDPPGTDKCGDLDQECSKQIDYIFNKGQADENSPLVSNILPERDSKKSEHVPYVKPLSVQRRSLGSAISVTSNESDYNELPTMIRNSPPRANMSPPRGIRTRDSNVKEITPKSALDDIKARALARDILKSPSSKPVLHGLKARGPGAGRTDKYILRDRPLKGTPPLPSKPAVKLTSQTAL